VTIIVDTREDKLFLNALLAKKLDVKSDFLEVGDFLLGNSICIERKEGSDFLQSIRDRRIWEQALNMSQYEHPIICIVTGDIWRDLYFSQSKWIHKSYLGTISSLAISYGISVLTFETDNDFIDFVVQIEKQITSDKKSSRPKPLMRRVKTIQERKENCLAMVEGVGIQSAQRLLEKFGSINAIANAKEEDIEEIERMGKKTAQKIKETLN
jgi:ERCC4-type nuclease